MNIIHEINNINKKFASKGCKLKLEKRGEKLTIRGSLPCKENKGSLKIQRISLGINADRLGLEEAEKKLQLIIFQLELDQFEWKNWITENKSSKEEFKENIERKITKFEEYFFNEPKNEYLSSTRRPTWENSYKPYLKRILEIYNSSGNSNLENIFSKTLETYKEGSRSRKQCGTSLNVFAHFLDYKLPADWNSMARGYGLTKASFRDLPNDKLIEDLWEKIPNNSWKYVFGLMATYGLRNHEVFFCDLTSLESNGDKILRVLPTTKTGEHQVWPFHPKWVDFFDLDKLGKDKTLLPSINTDLKPTTLQKVGKKITDQFKRFDLKIKPYDLRHAWAVLPILYDLPDTVAARMMGHSVNVHTQTYHHWITKRDQQKAVNKALLKFNERESL